LWQTRYSFPSPIAQPVNVDFVVVSSYVAQEVGIAVAEENKAVVCGDALHEFFIYLIIVGRVVDLNAMYGVIQLGFQVIYRGISRMGDESEGKIVRQVEQHDMEPTLVNLLAGNDDYLVVEVLFHHFFDFAAI
jgi:hypothetical protein